jgi:hypothetical protein
MVVSSNDTKFLFSHRNQGAKPMQENKLRPTSLRLTRNNTNCHERIDIADWRYFKEIQAWKTEEHDCRFLGARPAFLG